MLRNLTTVTAFILFVLCANAKPQQEDSLSAQQLPSNYLDNVSSKANQLEQKLDKKSAKALQQMMKLEERIKRKISGVDSGKGKEIFADAEQKYKDLEQRLQSGLLSKNYIASLDTLSTSLKFLQQNPQLLSKTKEAEQKLKDALSKVNGLENQFQKAEEIRNFLKERKDYLKHRLGDLNFARELKKINKTVFYFGSQLQEYQTLLKDHKRAEKKAIDLLSRTKLFKNFMQKNSQLASLFRLPGNDSDPLTLASLAGLQTRSSVNQLIQQQLSSGGPNAQQQLQQNIQQAQNQLSDLKNKINQLGGSNSDMEMPEGFRANPERTKSWLKRLEYSVNIQSQKATNFFPAHSDIGLSVGYRLSPNKIVSLGMAYSVGLGRGWNHIRITHEGIQLRSSAEFKLRGSFWFYSGFEMHYRAAFNRIDQLKNLSAWGRSGLAGVGKVISLKTKFFKKTKLQLLWDFFSYQQVPRTQPIVFRVGYNF